MKNKLGNIIVIIVFVLLIGVSFFYVFKDGVQNSIKLGLDLKGGTQIILKPVEKGTEGITEEAINKAELIILNRIDKLGISEHKGFKQRHNSPTSRGI
jgi:preprotein translocase subunit SecD